MKKLLISWAVMVILTTVGVVHANDLLYSLVTPCRIVDTRIGGGGIFSPGQKREFYVYGPSGDIAPQGGNPAGCPAPSGEPSAVHINVTPVPESGEGYLGIYPAGVSPPLASVVNYRAGSYNAIANAATIKTYVGFSHRDIEVINMYGTTHLAIDVMGYYYPNPYHTGPEPEIRVKTISFNYSGSGAITLYDNVNANFISAPEYDSISGIYKAAAWTMGGTHSVEVEFEAESSISSAEIWADNGLGGLNNSGSPVTVSFSGGTGKGTFSVNNPPTSIGKHLFYWNWNYKNVNGASTPATSIGTTGEHLLYTVYGTPNAPMTTPWLEVIDSACIWAQGESGLTAARTKITAGLNSIADNDGDVDYNPANLYTSGSFSSWQFNLTSFLWDLHTRSNMEINCADCANALTVYQNALGLGLQYRILYMGGLTNYIDPIGNGNTSNATDPVENWGITAWSWHCVGWLSGDIVYDANLHLDGDGTPSAPPHTRLAPVNIDSGPYCNLLAAPGTPCNPGPQNVCTVY